MTEIKHTPLPWKFTPWHIEEDAASVRSPQGWAICFTSGDANAEFIATSCNSYYATRTALLQAKAWIEHFKADKAAGLMPTDTALDTAIAEIDAVLA